MKSYVCAMGLTLLFACETSTGPQSESGLEVLQGPGDGTREHIVRVSEKQHYTEADPGLVTIFLVDPDVDSSSVLVSVAYLDPYQHWTSVIWLEVYQLGIFYVRVRTSYGWHENYAALLSDPYLRLPSRQVRIRYTP